MFSTHIHNLQHLLLLHEHFLFVSVWLPLCSRCYWSLCRVNKMCWHFKSKTNVFIPHWHWHWISIVAKRWNGQKYLHFVQRKAIEWKLLYLKCCFFSYFIIVKEIWSLFIMLKGHKISFHCVCLQLSAQIAAPLKVFFATWASCSRSGETDSEPLSCLTPAFPDGGWLRVDRRERRGWQSSPASLC